MANTMMTYTVVNSTYSAGQAGGVTDNGTTIGINQNQAQDGGLNGDPTVHTFFDTSNNPRVAVAQYANGFYLTTYIYDPTTNPWSLVEEATWSNLENLYDLVKVGSYLYGIDYDNGKVAEIEMSTYAETGAVFQFSTRFGSIIPSPGQANGIALANVGGTLYGLFSIVDNPWATTPQYMPSVVVKFTINTGVSPHTITVGTSAGDYNVGLGMNAFDLVANGSYFYIPCIGGQQKAGTYNAASQIQRVTIAGLTDAITVMQPDATNFPYDFHDITFDGSTAIILGGQYASGWTSFVGKLVSTTDFSTLTSLDTFNVAAYYWGAQYTPENSRLWYARGNAINVWESDGTVVQNNTGTALGGATYNIVNSMSYLSSLSTGARHLRGYRSPTQAARTSRAIKARSLAQGRPELLPEETAKLA